MDITFHYFVVKTLAYYAEIEEEEAQKIAFYSQYIDNYSIEDREEECYINVEGRPPEFFVKNNLAKKNGDTWLFYPAETAISLGKTMSFDEKVRKNHCKHTIVPFHFIPPKALNEFKEDEPEESYRCIKAAGKKNLLINKMMYEFMMQEEKDPVEFGMLLHTYADSFAHQGYSGFCSDVNKLEIENVNDNIFKDSPQIDLNALIDNFNKTINFLPPVGHLQALTIPDMFSLNYKLKFKVPQLMKSMYERDNTEEFLLCTRKIADFLCDYNNRKYFDDKMWNHISNKIIRAEGSAINSIISCLWENGKNNDFKITDILSILKQQKDFENDDFSKYFDGNVSTKLWNEEFENINYNYNPKDMFILKEKKSERKDYTVYIADDEFYKLNKAAYKQIKRVTGEFKS